MVFSLLQYQPSSPRLDLVEAGQLFSAQVIACRVATTLFRLRASEYALTRGRQ